MTTYGEGYPSKLIHRRYYNRSRLGWNIKRSEFQKDTHGRATVETIIAEA